MTYTRSIVREAASRALGGTPVRIEGTGGGCEVLAAYPPDTSLVVVLGDGNLMADFDHEDAVVGVGVYTVDAWNDSGEAIVNDVSTDLSADAVETMVRNAIRYAMRSQS